MTVLFLDAPEQAVGWGVDTLRVEDLPWLPSWPTAPDVVDWEAPDNTDPTRARHVQAAVWSISEGDWKGELLGARLSGPRTLDVDGGGDATWTVPTSSPALLDTLLNDVQSWGDLTTGRLDLIDRAIFPVVDGEVCPPYVCRGEATVRDGLLTIPCQAPTRLFQDRIIGEGVRKDLLNGRGSFPDNRSLSSLGIYWYGAPGDIRWTNNGVRGGRALEIRGTPPNVGSYDGDYLMIQSLLREPEGVTGQQVTVRSSAFINVPDDDIPQTDVVKTEVYNAQTGVRYWPALGDDQNTGVAQTDEDTPHGEFGRDPMVSAGLLPVPPYEVLIRTYIYPQSPVKWTGVSEITQFRRDTLSSGVPRDLTEHLAILVRESQTRRGKSTWNLPVDTRALTGTSELLVVRSEDETPLTEAIAERVEREDGPAAPWVNGAWNVVATARRGRVRTDLLLTEVDVISTDGWTHDPGSMASEVRGLTDRGEAYWRVSSVATDTSRTHGQVIERQMRAPNDLPLLALDQWTRARLAEVAQPQETTRFVVPYDLGRRIEVGDTFRCLLVDGYVRLDRQMSVIQQGFDDEAEVIFLDMGVEE